MQRERENYAEYHALFVGVERLWYACSHVQFVDVVELAAQESQSVCM